MNSKALEIPVLFTADCADDIGTGRVELRADGPSVLWLGDIGAWLPKDFNPCSLVTGLVLHLDIIDADVLVTSD